MDKQHTPKIDYIYMITFFVLSLGIQWCKSILKMDIFSSKLWVQVGAVILIFGILNSLLEKYKSFGLMTIENRNNLLIVNSCIPGTLGVALVSSGYLMNIGITLAVLVLLGTGRYILDKKRCDKFNKYIGKKGVAETEITLENGKVRLSEDEVVDAMVIEGMVKKGSKVEITGMLGYKLVIGNTKRKK